MRFEMQSAFSRRSCIAPASSCAESKANPTRTSEHEEVVGAASQRPAAQRSPSAQSASLAHPGLLRCDEIIGDLAENGLTALEAYHCDHDAQMTEHYRSLARRYDLAVTGGSDYHGDASDRESALGVVGLPEEEFQKLRGRLGRQPTRRR